VKRGDKEQRLLVLRVPCIPDNEYRVSDNLHEQRTIRTCTQSVSSYVRIPPTCVQPCLGSLSQGRSPSRCERESGSCKKSNVKHHPPVFLGSNTYPTKFGRMVHERASVFMGMLLASASRMLGNATKNGPARPSVSWIMFMFYSCVAHLSMRTAPSVEWPNSAFRVWVGFRDQTETDGNSEIII
jgi:hypothetical protein